MKKQYMNTTDFFARRVAPVFFCILLIAAFELTGAMTATAQVISNPPTPFACVDPTPVNGRHGVRLAYDNPQTEIRFFPVGKPVNYFEPNAGNEYYGQPSFFQPGYNEIGFVFSLPSGQSTSWVLGAPGDEKRALVDPSNPATHCPPPITFQGRLSNAGAAANGTFDLQFTAYDALTGGTVQSAVIVKEDVTVTNGVFTVYLDTLMAFHNRNAAKFLQIGVRRGTSTGAFTILAPRQPITPAPYAITAQNAFNATNAAQLNGIPGNQYLTSSSNGSINGTLNVTGAITSGCRVGFTAIAGGRLCVSTMRAPATFYGSNGAVQTCTNMQARVGNSADAMLTFTQSDFNYFNGYLSGWLADSTGDNKRATWLANAPTPDFDGPSLDVYNGGNAPSLPYRCVY